jgi:hypothetical protein
MRTSQALWPAFSMTGGHLRWGWGLLVALILVGAPACDCSGKKQVSNTRGQLVLTPNPVDFEQVILGQQKEIKVTAKNIGRTTINVKSIQRSDGFPEDFRFSPASLELEGGAEKQLQIFFTPKVEGEKTASLNFLDDNSATATELPLKGIGVRPVITATPTAIDFGIVVVGEVVTETFDVKNEGNGSLDVVLDSLTSDHSEAFAVSFPGANPKSFHIEPGQTAQVSVSFQPSQVGDHNGAVNLKPCSSCAVVSVALKGIGAASALLATPSPFDFGAVLPKTKATQQLTLKNIGTRPILLKSLTPETAGTPFTVGALPTVPVSIAAGASIIVNIEFAPKTIGPQSTRLVFESDDPRVNAYRFPISGYGGGGTLSISPPVMDFGYVAIGFPVTRRLMLTNTGVSDPTTDLDNVVIEAIDLPAGLDFDLPDGTTSVTIQPGQRQYVNVRFNPASAGAQEGNLVLHTDDAAASSAIVRLKGEGVLAANCSYVVKPDPTPGIQFGMINRGRQARQSFSIQNIGLTECIIGKIELAANSDPAFTLVDGPIFGQKLAPGDRLMKEVEFAPPGTASAAGANFAGVVQVAMSSGGNPTSDIQLSGRAAEVCVTVTPTSADFGVVKPLCETNEKSFRIYNACSSTVSVTKILAGAGQSDFRLTVPPTFPVILDPQTGTTTSQPRSSMSFTVRYRPTDVGPDLGTIQIFTSQTTTGGQPYVISLTGRGDNNATASESFTQAERAAADILFVVDDSGSMSDKQEKLSQNFSSFMDFALQQQIDYHMAVTSTGTDSDRYCSSASDKINGQFMPLTGADRIITPQTVDPAKVFARNVKVGTDGCATEQGLEGAYRALSDPNINGTNAGFLRPDAYLSIIIVTDAEDQSDFRTLDFYTDFFQNLKGPRGANMLSVSAVADTDAAVCAQTGVYTEGSGAQRYIAMANRTGGIARSICLEDWADALQELGLAAFGYKSRFILNSEPDPTSVKVYVDGMEVEESGSWEYIQTSNSIDFLPTTIPPAGAKIDVSYTVACH